MRSLTLRVTFLAVRLILEWARLLHRFDNDGESLDFEFWED